MRLRLHLSHILEAQETVFTVFNTCVVGQRLTSLLCNVEAGSQSTLQKLFHAIVGQQDTAAVLRDRFPGLSAHKRLPQVFFSKGLKRDIWW